MNSSTQDQTDSQDEQIIVFKTLEKIYGPLPLDLKNALTWSGYDNFIVLSNIKEAHIKKIDEHFKETTKRSLLPGYIDTLAILSAEIRNYGIPKLAAMAVDTKTEWIIQNPLPKRPRKVARPEGESETPAALPPPDPEVLKKAVAEQIKRLQLMKECQASDIIITQAPESEGGAFSVKCPLCKSKINVGVTRSQRASRWVPSNIYCHLKAIHAAKNGEASAAGQSGGFSYFECEPYNKRQTEYYEEDEGDEQYLVKEEYVETTSSDSIQNQR